MIADDMGLGKTLQVIAAILCAKIQGFWIGTESW
ncbi:SNF2-related protein [Wolbachia endosymbiont of Drosophila seguyi]